jgi:hypothetical protein
MVARGPSGKPSRVLAAALAGTAVSLAPASRAGAQVDHDSAGAAVVRNAAGADAALQWVIGPEPQVEIGGAPDDARYQLFRVAGAARLSDGRIVVADGGSFELRFYDARGTYVSAVGREGEGPGEFRLLSGLEVGEGDSIYVFDRRLQRVSVFGAGGALVRDLRVPPSAAPLEYVGRFADGRWYARDRDRLLSGPAGAIRRDTARFLGLDAAFERRFAITAFPGVMTASFRAGGRTGYRTAPFSPSPAQDVFRDCLYVVSGDKPEVRVFSSEGRPVLLVKMEAERRPVSDAQRAAWVEDLVAEVPAAANPALRQVLEGIPTPEELPVFNNVVVDAHGYIWLQEYMPQTGSGRSWSGSGRRWLVLSPGGWLLGRVEMPVALDVFAIGPDHVLGLWRDGVGEELVRLYRLRGRGDPRPRPPTQCGAGVAWDGVGDNRAVGALSIEMFGEIALARKPDGLRAGAGGRLLTGSIRVQR